MYKSFNPNEMQEDLLSKRILYLSGEINSEMASKFGKAVVWLNAQESEEDITLYIDSNGGAVTPGLDIYDMIRHSKAPITGIVYRRAYSMASVILQGCVHRYALPHAEILVHGIRLGELSLIDIEDDIDKTLKRSRALQHAVNEIYKNRIGCSIKIIQRMNRLNERVSAQEALAQGLIDKLIT